VIYVARALLFVADFESEGCRFESYRARLPTNDLRRFAVPSANSSPHPADLPRSGPRPRPDRGRLGSASRGRPRPYRGDGQGAVGGGRGTM